MGFEETVMLSWCWWSGWEEVFWSRVSVCDEPRDLSQQWLGGGRLSQWLLLFDFKWLSVCRSEIKWRRNTRRKLQDSTFSRRKFVMKSKTIYTKEILLQPTLRFAHCLPLTLTRLRFEENPTLDQDLSMTVRNHSDTATTVCLACLYNVGPLSSAARHVQTQGLVTWVDRLL